MEKKRRQKKRKVENTKRINRRDRTESKVRGHQEGKRERDKENKSSNTTTMRAR